MRDKNNSARLCTKKAGVAYAQGGAYLQDTTVHVLGRRIGVVVGGGRVPV